MARKFSDLRARMSPESQERARSKARALWKSVPLQELRQARGLSQKDLATALHVQQPTIARIEKRTDMYISTLRSHIEAMGGELEVIARFPEGTVRVSNFAELGEEKSNRARKDSVEGDSPSQLHPGEVGRPGRMRDNFQSSASTGSSPPVVAKPPANSQ